jgi:hypothetical protein
MYAAYLQFVMLLFVTCIWYLTVFQFKKVSLDYEYLNGALGTKKIIKGLL